MPVALQRLFIVLLALTPQMAFAHPGHEASGLLNGFAHPLMGIDHILAMVTVGVLASQLSGRALWVVPGTFLAVMALGVGIGSAGASLPALELALALSVIALGAIVALEFRGLPVAVVVAVGLFALVHGHVHGSEMPAHASALTYGFGLLGASALLHLGGILLGHMFGAWRRVGGAVVALGGLGLMLQAL